MIVYSVPPERCPASETAVALGMFDGLHRGHLAVLNALVNESNGVAACVFTFSTSVSRPPSKAPVRLLSGQMRDELLSGLGISYVFEPEFSDFKDMPAEVFAKDFLCGYLNAKKIFCGEDFHFGKNAAAGAGELRAMLPETVQVRMIPAVEDSGGKISSTRIRGLVQDGDMPEAGRLLGRAFTVDFPVEHGRKLGRKLDWPTINQPFPDDFAVPRFGVYASVTIVDGSPRASVTNVGVKPTVGGSRVLAETYIQDYSGDLYGRRVKVGLLKFIRAERKFESLEALRNQIEIDSEQAGKFVEASLKGGYTCTIY